MIIHYLAFSFFILLHFPDQRGSVKSFSSFTLISLLYIWNDEIIQCHFRKKKVVTVSFHNWWWFVLSKYTILPDHSSDYYVDPFELRQGLQKLVFPGGVLFDNEVDDYRTDNENEVFKIFRRISANYKEDKTKATSNFHCLSLYVGMRRLERPTPTSRT